METKEKELTLTAEQQELMEDLRPRVEAKMEFIRDLAASNPEIVNAEAGIQSTISATGSVSVITLLFYQRLTAELTYGTGEKFSFTGNLGGIGFGGGTSVGVFLMAVPPSQLAGGNNVVQANFIASGPSGFEVNWWRNNQFIGSFIGAGFGFGGGVTAGAGTWKRVN